MTERLSEKVMIEYLKVADWADRQAALRSPVGDTMHGLSAEAIRALVAEVRELRATVERVRALHRDIAPGFGCSHCADFNYPCPTIKSVDGDGE
jgi:hypothetical protein